jgi:hypothetical protein
MKKAPWQAAVAAGLAVALVFSVAAAAAPPRVIKASPDNGAVGVDPATPEIRIVFDQRMSTGGFSFVGARSYGSSGNPKPHDLGNGVTVYLPSWQDLMPDGKLLEGVGVEPDVAVPARPSDLARSDLVLEAALRVLRSPAPAGGRPTGTLPRVKPSACSAKADGICRTSACAMCPKDEGAYRFRLEEVLR